MDEEDRRRNAEYQRRYVERKLAGADAAEFRRYRAEKAARWERKHHEAAKANEAVGWAVFRGELVKPTTCEECGAEAELDGHHNDYTRKLNVRWLCRRCHKAVHRTT